MQRPSHVNLPHCFRLLDYERFCVIRRHRDNTNKYKIKSIQKHRRTTETDSVQPPPIHLGTITQMEAFMKHWWKQSALYNAQPCTLLHFQLIRSAQLQKGERLPRQPPISPPPSPSVPLFFPVYYRQRSHGRGKSNHFCTGTNARICTSITKPVWSPESSGGKSTFVKLLLLSCSKIFLNKRGSKLEVLLLFVREQGDSFANTCVSMKFLLFALREWVSECFASWCGALRRTAHHQSWCRSSAANGCEGRVYRVKLPHFFSVSPALALCVCWDNSEPKTLKVISCLQSRTTRDGREILSCAPSKCGFMLPTDWSKLSELVGLLPLEQGK